MDIDRLRYFRAMVEASGLDQASRVLHITPGALSKALRQLEAEVEQKLFHKEGRRLALTTEGERLYRLSGPLLEQYEGIRAAMREAKPPAPLTLTLASFEVFTTHFLGALVAKLDDAPLRVMDVGVSKIVASVASEQADVGLTYIPSPNAELVFEAVGELEFGVFGASSAFGECDLGELPFAVPRSPLRAPYDDAQAIDCWPGDRVTRHIRFWLTSLESALELSRRKACVCYIPTVIAGLHNRSVRRGLRLSRLDEPGALPKVTRRVFMLRPRHTPPRPEVIRFAEAVEAIIAGPW